MKTIAIVNYGGNLRSLTQAFNKVCDHKVIVTKDADVIKNADRIVLPGQGSAGAAMDELNKAGLVEVIRELEQPILGICLGMQLFMDYSYEGDFVNCLGMIKGFTSKLPCIHTGWNSIIGLKDAYYFNHSYRINPDRLDFIKDGGKDIFTEKPSLPWITLKHTRHVYGIYNFTFVSVIRNRNLLGVQFHPEKSHKQGLEILSQFVN